MCLRKMNGANCRRLMNSHEQIIDGIIFIFIDMNECIVSNDDIIIIIYKHKTLLKQLMNHIVVWDHYLLTTDTHWNILPYLKTIQLYKQLKLPVTPSSGLLEDHIIN